MNSVSWTVTINVEKQEDCLLFETICSKVTVPTTNKKIHFFFYKQLTKTSVSNYSTTVVRAMLRVACSFTDGSRTPK